jgi:hypothetical protein
MPVRRIMDVFVSIWKVTEPIVTRVVTVYSNFRLIPWNRRLFCPVLSRLYPQCLTMLTFLYTWQTLVGQYAGSAKEAKKDSFSAFQLSDGETDKIERQDSRLQVNNEVGMVEQSKSWFIHRINRKYDRAKKSLLRSASESLRCIRNQLLSIFMIITQLYAHNKEHGTTQLFM